MEDNLKQNIIPKSWEFVTNDIKIKKFYFFPGLISIIFLMIVSVYQIIYTYVELFNQEDKALKVILKVFHSGYLKEILIVGGIFLVFYIILMPICEGALIWYISKKEDIEKDISISDSLGNGLYRFLPLFEYGNLFSEFKFISLINTFLFCLRFVGIEYIKLLSYVFLFLLIISTIINIFFTYSRFEIVLNNKKVLESIGESMKITILNLNLTIKVYFFLFLLNIRIIINFLVFLIFPIIIATALIYITTKIYLFIAIIFLSIIFLIFIVILGYLGGVFEILKTVIWYNAYMDGKKKIEELHK